MKTSTYLPMHLKEGKKTEAVRNLLLHIPIPTKCKIFIGFSPPIPTFQFYESFMKFSAENVLL